MQLIIEVTPPDIAIKRCFFIFFIFSWASNIEVTSPSGYRDKEVQDFLLLSLSVGNKF